MTFAVAPLSRKNREALSSPREGAIIFRDLVGKLGVLATSMTSAVAVDITSIG